MTITTIDDMRTHLQWAVEVEHSTIPPYLYAYYSIVDKSSPAAQTFREIVVEEMIHMALACNIFNAIGGHPSISDPSFVPSYPGMLPHHAQHPPLIVHLQPASLDSIGLQFLEIERPEGDLDPPEDDNYSTIGQLYKAIKEGFAFLVLTVGEPALFSGNPSLQVTDIAEGNPELVAITNLSTADAAINRIVEQGEGTSQTEEPDGEFAHYWRFSRIVDGGQPLGKVFPAATDPHTAPLAIGSVRQLSQLFNDCYGLLLRTLHKIFNGGDSATLNPAVIPLMTGVLGPIAQLLMKTPITTRHGANPPGTTAGPSFEFSNPVQSTVVANCSTLTNSFPTLHGVLTMLQGLPAGI